MEYSLFENNRILQVVAAVAEGFSKAMSPLNVIICLRLWSGCLPVSCRRGCPECDASPGSCHVVGGHTVKAMEPLFEAAVIDVNVLDMHGAVDAQASAFVIGVLRKVAVGRIAVTHQQHILGQHRLQHAAQLDFSHLSTFCDPPPG